MTFENKAFKIRVSCVLSLFLMSFVALTARSVQLHLFADERIANMGQQNNRNIHLSTKRGTIFDRKGRTLALSLKVPSYFVDPYMFKPNESELKKLAELFASTPRELLKDVKNGSRRFAWVNRFGNPQIEDKVKELNIEGLHFVNEWKRFYPDKELAGQVLGFVGYEGRGLEGIEKQYDDQLVQEERIIKTKKDGKGRTIYSEVAAIHAKKKNTHIALSIDANLQYILEEKISLGAKETQSDSAVGVLMDPHTGEVLAMASYPPVNPNQFSQYPMENWRNRAVQEVFEPGSTFKIFTLAAALDEKTVKPDQLFHCEEGSLSFGGKSIRNSIEKAWLKPKGILKYSNNIGTARIGLDLGAKNLFKAIHTYGFGEKTGLDFPGELRGLLSDYKAWQPMDLANISFGQGLGVTAIQMASAVSSFANGGFALKPKIVLEKGIENKSSDMAKARVMSSKTVEFIRAWMEAVTEQGGTGSRARVDGFRVAGKTGSAQMIDRSTGSYSNSDLFSSFIGFAPLHEPKYALFIGYRKPKQYRHGGELAAPVFSAVMSEALQYAGIKPTEIDETAYLKTKVADTSKEELREDLQDQLMNLKGRSLREVLSWASKQNFDVEVIGHGNVYAQTPDAGSSTEDLHKVKVYLSSSLGEAKI